MKTLLSLLIAAAMGWSIPASSAERVKISIATSNKTKTSAQECGSCTQLAARQRRNTTVVARAEASLDRYLREKRHRSDYPDGHNDPLLIQKDTSGLIVKNNSCFSIVALAVSVSTKSLSAKTDAAGTYVVYGQLK